MLTEKQLEARRLGIGGSDAGSILGVNQYKTPLQVYLEKRGEAEAEDLSDNQAVHFGNKLEDLVAEEFSDRTKLKVRRSNQHLEHPDHGFILANIDRSVVGRPFDMKCGLECKTAGTWAATPHLWGPGAEIGFEDTKPVIYETDDKVPDHYLLQCAHYMAVTGSDLWFLAVLIGGQEFRIYTIFRDEMLEKLLIRREWKFWNDHVMAGRPPAATTHADLDLLYGIDNGQAVIADVELRACVSRARTLQTEIKARQTELDDAKLIIKNAIGQNAELLIAPDDTKLATWKSPKASQRFSQQKLKTDYPDIYRACLEDYQPSRRLLIKGE